LSVSLDDCVCLATLPLPTHHTTTPLAVDWRWWRVRCGRSWLHRSNSASDRATIGLSPAWQYSQNVPVVLAHIYVTTSVHK